MPEPPSLLDTFEPDRRKTAATVDTNIPSTLSGPKQKKPGKGLVCFADQISFLASRPHKPNSLATSKRWAWSLGQALRGFCLDLEVGKNKRRLNRLPPFFTDTHAPSGRGHFLPLFFFLQTFFFGLLH